MAIALGNTLVTGSSTTNATSTYTTATLANAPGAGRMVVGFFAVNASASTPTLSSISGAGLSSIAIHGTSISFDTTGTPLARMYLFRAQQSGAGATTALTFTLSSSTNVTGAAWGVYEFTGCADDTANNGANNIVQVVSHFSDTNATSLTATSDLAAASHTNNRPIAAFYHRANEATTFRTNWTELGDTNQSNPTMGFETQWRSDAFETTYSASWTTSSRSGALAAELRDASAVAGGSNTAEGGSDGTTVTTGNSGGSSGTAWTTVDSTSTMEFDNARTMHGSMAYRSSKAGATNSYVGWGSGVGPDTATYYFRGYFNFQAPPDAHTYFVTFYDGGTYCVGLSMSTAGYVRILDQNGVSQTTDVAALANDTWYRIEAFFDVANQQGTFKVFVGDSLDTYDSQSTGTAEDFGSVNLDGVRIGAGHNTTSLTYEVWFDDIKTSATGWIGPSVAGYRERQVAVTATGSSAVSGTVVGGAKERAVAVSAASSIATAGYEILPRAVAVTATADIAVSGNKSTPGAFEPVLLTEGADTTNATTYTTGSISPTANGLLFVHVLYQDASGDTPGTPTPTTSLSGITFTQQAHSAYDDLTTPSAAHMLYTAPVGASPGTGTITFGTFSDALAGCVWKVFEIAEGFDATPYPQSAVTAQDNADPSPSLTATLGSALQGTDSIRLALYSKGGSEAIVPYSGDTAIGSSVPLTAPAVNIHASWDVNETAANFSWTGSNRATSVIVFEVEAAGVVTTERAVAVTATGAIATAGYEILPRSVAVSATTLIATRGIEVLPRAVAVSATALIAMDGAPVKSRSVAVSATSAIATAAYEIIPRSVAVSAATLIATSRVFFTVESRTVAVTATGLIAMDGAPVKSRSVAVNATALVAMDGAPVKSRTIAVTATGAVATAGMELLPRAVAVSATAAIASAGFEILPRGTAATAAASISVVGQKYSLRQVSVTGVSGISSIGAIQGAVFRSIAVSAATSISTAGFEILPRSVAVSATASTAVSGVGFTIESRSVASTASATIAVASIRYLLRQAAVNATATIVVANFRRDRLRQVASSASSSIAVSGSFFHVLQRLVAVSATGTIATVGDIDGIISRQIAVSGSTSITVASFQRALQRAVAVVAATDLNAAGSIFHLLERVASLDAAGTITVSAIKEILRSVDIGATVTIESQAALITDREVWLAWIEFQVPNRPQREGMFPHGLRVGQSGPRNRRHVSPWR